MWLQVQAPCGMQHGTINQRCAANIMQTTHRMALRGIQRFSRVLGCWMACVRARGTQTMNRRGMKGTRPTSDAQQTLCRRCTEG